MKILPYSSHYLHIPNIQSLNRLHSFAEKVNIKFSDEELKC